MGEQVIIKILVMKLVFLFSFLIALVNPGIKNNSALTTANANVDGVNYRAILYGDQSISIKNGDKTILHIKRADLYVTFEHFAGLEFKDFNGDGYPDLVVNYKSNIPGRCDLMLYDKRSKQFKQVSGFPEYPASIKIPNSVFYYSYHKSGCGDMDWDSDLYKIVNYKIVSVGTIAGRGCEGSTEPQGISIFRKAGKKEHLVKKQPITELSKYNGNKTAFIDQYWKANYMKF
jgi:hypothetical protein